MKLFQLPKYDEGCWNENIAYITQISIKFFKVPQN